MTAVVVTNILCSTGRSAIFSGRTDDGGLLRVIVDEPVTPAVGDVYEVAGEQEFIREHGRTVAQVRCRTLVRVRSSGTLIMPWLMQIAGVGSTRAKRLWESFGHNLLDTLLDPEKVDDLALALDPERPALARKLAEAVHAAMVTKQAEDDHGHSEALFRLRLEALGITDKAAVRRLWRMLGSAEAEQKVMAYPYMLAALLPWSQADHIGQRVLRERRVQDALVHPERLAGMCDAVVRSLLKVGDTAWTVEQVLKSLCRMGCDRDQAWIAATAGHQHGALVEGREGLLRAPGAAWMEDQISARFARMATGQEVTEVSLPDDLEVAVSRAEALVGMQLHPEQRAAVIAVIGKDLAVLQGGAGTGKTATMRVLVRLWEEAGGRVEMACLAGKAALTLSRATGKMARTITRLVSALERREHFREEGRESDLPADWPRLCGRTLLIVDEASMVDLGGWHRLVTLMPVGCRLLMVGDDGQLPPVGIGDLFRALVGDARVASRLTTIHRQGESSGIPAVAALVREGRAPDLNSYVGAGAGVSLLECPPDAVNRTVEAIVDELGGHSSDGNLMICAALRATVAGINQVFAVRRHRGKDTIFAAPNVRVGPGDPVVACRNHYDLGLFNGLLGTVLSVDPSAGCAQILWDGETEAMVVEQSAIGDVDLAYAITCHRAQGSAARRVVVPVERTRLLTRQWLYTAITRAHEQVVLVGSRADLEAALRRQSFRQTGFSLPTHLPVGN
ncbi:MAG: AAA family ATPase [Actinomycetota bacterium]